METETETG